MNIETHKFGAEVGRLLHLVIHSLYKNKDIFLRELISNASDACDKLKFIALSNPELMGDDAELNICISFNKTARTITITDNGIGMSGDELAENLGTIAKSGTAEFIKHAGEIGKDRGVELIGQFGVGFYSAFMVAESVDVESVKAGETRAHLWHSKGEGEFTISRLEIGGLDSEKASLKRGTRITLHLLESEAKYLDFFKLEYIIRAYSDHISHPVILWDEEADAQSSAGGEKKRVNSAAALWSRPKSEITLEQYNEFYRHVSHAIDEPWHIIHNKNEGKLEYTNLLFIPSRRPFDIFHPDRMRRIKLYVKRVFITEDELDIIPHWLRFIRGVVDSEDLPLNVSRETLQNNAMLERIKSAISKRVLKELSDRLAKSKDDYLKFWENFGQILKEGLCEATPYKTEILQVSLFRSTSHEEFVSLADYGGRMIDGQEKIYYLCCDSYEDGLKNPMVEGFKSRGIEVLLFTDTVDDFWVNVIGDYEGKELVSISRSGIDLSFANAGEKKAKDSENRHDNAKNGEYNSDNSADITNLVSRLKQFYAEKATDYVSDVRISAKLVETPATLASDGKGMDMRLEKYLFAQQQIHSRSAKIMEINPNHPIIEAMSRLIHNENGGESFQEVALMVLDQALIIAGEEPVNASEFSRRLTKLMKNSILESA
jgi:molecular chaperone HtpG